MDNLLTEVCSQQVKNSILPLYQLVWMNSGTYEGIEVMTIGNIANQYLRMLNAKRAGYGIYPLERYLFEVREAGMMIESNVIHLAHGCRIVTKEEQGTAVFAAEGCHNMYFSPIRTAPEAFAQHLKQMSEAIPEVCDMLRMHYFDMKREHKALSVEYSLIEHRLKEALASRGVVYDLTMSPSGCRVDVNIMDGVMMEGPVSAANLERVVEQLTEWNDNMNLTDHSIDGFKIVHME